MTARYANAIIRRENMPGQQPVGKPRAARFTGAKAIAKRKAAQEASMILPRDITFWIDAEPMGAPRMTQRDKWDKRDCVVRYRAFCNACLVAAGPNIPPASRVMELRVVANFYNGGEACGFNEYREKPDGDNVLKSICDALWKDDHKLGSLVVERFWTNHKAGVRVYIHTSEPNTKPASDGDAYSYLDDPSKG